MSRTILFVDFDGTVTSEETFSSIIKRYNDPDLFKQRMIELQTGQKQLNDIVHEAFSYISCDKMPEIFDYIRSVPIRPGFEEMLVTAKDLGIRVIILSGGLRPYIEDKLAPFTDKGLIWAIHAVDVDLSGETMRLHSKFEEGSEILNKSKVMATYEYDHAICIGDSVADISMVKASDTVFARDSLCEICGKLGIPYTTWETHFDIADALRALPRD